MRSALFWDVTRRGVVIVYQQLFTNNYHTTPLNTPAEGRSLCPYKIHKDNYFWLNESRQKKILSN
jgi:hypothetical protein